MVEYLASLNIHPAKIKNQDYWYLSPLSGRNEKEPSFKINRKKNVWYDHALGKGGDMIDFGTLYHNCSVKELLSLLSGFKGNTILSFHPPAISGVVSGAIPQAGEKKETTDSKIVLVETRPLANPKLTKYLQKRGIPLEIANKYCREVDFLLYSKRYTVIGFENRSGGYELSSENFKGSSSPKDVSLIDNKTENLVVFEGFFSFLSFATINRNQTTPLTNCLILNSLSFFEKSRSLAKIERVLALKNQISQKQGELNALEKMWQTEQKGQQELLTPMETYLENRKERYQKEERSFIKEEIEILKEVGKGIIYDLLKPEYTGQSIDPNWLQEYRKRKRKKLRHSQRL
jgi:hypothetical protein